MTGATDLDERGERLARVTYLPGVVPPSEPVAEPVPDLAPKRLAGYGTADLSDVKISDVKVSDVKVSDIKVSDIRQQMEEITSRPQAELPETDGERSARAHNVSMHALTRKGQSRAEIVDLLRRRDLEENDIQVEVSRLEAVGLINDYELAETLVRTLRDRKALGSSAITAELRRRKIDAAAIEQAISDAGDTRDDELTRAREVAAKRAPQLRSLDAETARRRLSAFLMRKGYSGSVVASAVASALSSNAPTTRGPRFE
jgi:regulatory protein